MHDSDSLLSQCDFIITYSPLLDEAYIPVPSGKESYILPTDRTLDPSTEAQKLIDLARGRKTATLLPGTRFDTHGTRHGRGGGWYDRFLAAVPAEWLRVGVCMEDQWSDAPLPRESWDEPVDYVAVVGATVTWIETKAR